MAQTNTIISQSQKEKLERFVKTSDERLMTIGDFNRCLLGYNADPEIYNQFCQDHSEYLTEYATKLLEGVQ